MLSWDVSMGDGITYIVEVSSDACEGISEINSTDAESITFSVRPATDYTFTVTAEVGFGSEKIKESEPATYVYSPEREYYMYANFATRSLITCMCPLRVDFNVSSTCLQMKFPLQKLNEFAYLPTVPICHPPPPPPQTHNTKWGNKFTIHVCPFFFGKKIVYNN